MRPWPDQTVTDSDGPGPEPGPGPGPGSSTVAVARAIIWHPMTAAAAFWQRDSDRWQAGVRIREGRLSHRPGRPPLKCRLNFQCGVHPGDPRRPGARRRGTMKVTSTTRKSRCSNLLQVLRRCRSRRPHSSGPPSVTAGDLFFYISVRVKSRNDSSCSDSEDSLRVRLANPRPESVVTQRHSFRVWPRARPP